MRHRNFRGWGVLVVGCALGFSHQCSAFASVASGYALGFAPSLASNGAACLGCLGLSRVRARERNFFQAQSTQTKIFFLAREAFINPRHPGQALQTLDKPEAKPGAKKH